MVNKPTVMIAIRNDEIEEYIRSLPVEVIEANDDIDIICDVLEFQTADFIIVNTLLSFRKAIKLAEKVSEMASSTKIIALVENPDKKMLAYFAALDVNAIVPINNLARIKYFLEQYPASFDFTKLAESRKGYCSTDSVQMLRPGTIAYAVFSVTPGAGATTFAIKLTEKLAICGERAVCVGFTEDKALERLPKKLRGEYLAAEHSQRDTIMQLLYSSNDYQHVIMDFGTLFHIDATGQLRDTNRALLPDFLRCNYRIGLTFSDTYHIHKLNFFKNANLFRNDTAQMDFLISGITNEHYLEEIIDYHEVLYREESDDYINGLLKRVGLLTDIGNRQRGFLSFLKRR